MLLHALKTLSITATIAVMATMGQAPSSGTDDLDRLTPDQLKASIERQHPAAYDVLAGKLFASGEKDDAVFDKGLAWDERTANEYTSKTTRRHMEGNS